MQLLLDTWGPPGKWCRSDRSLECPQTAPHHSPHSVLTPLGLPECGQYNTTSFGVIIIHTYNVFQGDIEGQNWVDRHIITLATTGKSTGIYSFYSCKPWLYSCLQPVHSVSNIKAEGDKTELFWKVIWLITWLKKAVPVPLLVLFFFSGKMMR